MLSWDGGDANEISPYVIGAREDDGVWAVRIDDETAYIHRYTDNLILFLDEIKPFFGLEKVGRMKATLLGKPVVLSRVSGEERYLEPGLDMRLAEDVRRCYLFRWACGLYRHSPRDMVVRSKYGRTRVTSYNDERLSKEKPLEKTVIERWFGHDSDYRASLAVIFFGESYYTLKEKLVEVAQRVAPDQVYVVDAIMLRLQNAGAFGD